PGQLGEAVLHEAVPDDQTQGDRGPAFRGIRYAFTQFQKAAEIRHDGHRIVFSSWWGHAILLMNSDALATRLQAHGFVRSAPASRKRLPHAVWARSRCRNRSFHRCAN